MKFIQHVRHRLGRKKHISIDDTTTNLQRCLTLKRLIFIGVGKTIGVGIYVLIGVATQQAGPGVILSFLIGFLVTLLNALCFSEYASKSPKTGAQYTYMYETIGEGVAFIVGWTSCVGFTSAFSLAARGWSGYLDSFFNHRIENFTETHIAHWTGGPPFPEYPDLPAIGMVLLIMIIVSLGVNFASIINSILATVSVALLMFIVIYGLFFANFDNWFNNKVGFFPNGFAGVLKAAASCFYAYQGFEIIGYSAEETVNPKKTIPRSIVAVLLIVTAVYLLVAIAFTLMIPISEINTKAPFPNAFGYHSVIWAKYLVAAGPVLALSNLCMLEMFGLQRLSYSMATDGLMFRCLSNVNSCTKVPIGPVFVFGPIVIGLVLVIDLSNLIGFVIIYTFIQYSLFSGYLIMLRYNETSSPIEKLHVQDSFDTEFTETKVSNTDSDETEFEIENGNHAIQQRDSKDLIFPVQGTSKEKYTYESEFEIEENGNHAIQNDSTDLIFRENSNNNEQYRKSSVHNEGHAVQIGRVCKYFNELSRKISVTQLVLLLYVLTFSLSLGLIHGPSDRILTAVICAVLGVPLVFSTFLIWCREQRGNRCGFLVPMMPFVPVMCLFFNMVMLLSVADKGSASAAAVTAVIGAVIYLVLVGIDFVSNKKRETNSVESQHLMQTLVEETAME